MKIRQGFVSNSSSSSFVIKLSDISGEQLWKILGAKDHIPEKGGYEWDIRVDGSYVKGSVFTDNSDMELFLKKIKVPEKAIGWGD